MTANGGKAGTTTTGGAGGSGGGKARTWGQWDGGSSTSPCTNGGSNGSNADNLTTREFSEVNGKLYSGGGGGGVDCLGGDGGGADATKSALANTGGGGGGNGGAGGSGIVVIRPTKVKQVGTISYYYSGLNEIIDEGNNNWKVRFLSSGKLTLLNSINVDLFLVGGGSGGTIPNSGGWAPDLHAYNGAGGSGGFTATYRNISLSATTYDIVIGSGGTVGNSGVASTAFGKTANGGSVGTSTTGGVGGSNGGNARTWDQWDGGSNTVECTNGSTNGSPGQGTTTLEFGEINSTLYSGGGGGGSTCTGGSGGGADANANAENNTGGGGGANASGGSGIVIIRNVR